jgi:hypothetical protein
MSAETEFRAALLAHAPLMALVVDAKRIAQNAAADGVGTPCIVYGSTRTPDFHLDNSAGATNVQFSVQCWDDTAAEASAIADAAVAALAAVQVVCTSRSTTFDDQLGLDGEELVFDWWE